MNVEFHYPGTFLGVDNAEQMLNYARSQAQDRGSDMTFDLGDITGKELFSSLNVPPPYNLIHLRFGGGLLKKEQWAPLLERCYEALKPGGWLYLGEWGEWNVSPSFHQFNTLTAEALYKAGYNFAQKTYAFLSPQLSVLEKIGYTKIEKQVFPLEYDGEYFQAYKRNATFAIHEIKTFFLRWNMISSEAYDALVHQALEELEQKERYHITLSVETIWAQKH